MAVSIRWVMNFTRFCTSATSSGSMAWRSFTRAPASSIRSDLSLLEFVIGDGGFHPVGDELHALLHLGHFVGQHGLAQFHARAGFIDQIRSEPSRIRDWRWRFPSGG